MKSKYTSPAGITDSSPPEWGAWIEMRGESKRVKTSAVAPRVGGVD